MIGIRFQEVVGNFSLRQRVQTVPGAHPGSYSVHTGNTFPVGKAVGAWSWPLISI